MNLISDAPSSSNVADVYDIDNEIEKDDPQPKKNKCEPSNLMKGMSDLRKVQILELFLGAKSKKL